MRKGFFFSFTSNLFFFVFLKYLLLLILLVFWSRMRGKLWQVCVSVCVCLELTVIMLHLSPYLICAAVGGDASNVSAGGRRGGSVRAQ